MNNLTKNTQPLIHENRLCRQQRHNHPSLPEVMEVMLPYFTEGFYNPSAISGREYGIDAAIARARRTVTGIPGCFRRNGDSFHFLCD